MSTGTGFDHVEALIGMADACELQASLWGFPETVLVDGIRSGAIASDALACLAEAGMDDEALHAIGRAFERLQDAAVMEGVDADTELAAMRAAHSRLFFAPTGRPVIYLSEGPFVFAASGAEGLPPLFATASVHSVEACMLEAGVEPRSAQSEPADSIVNEFSFLSYLLGCWARAAHDRSDEARLWEERARAFWKAHAACWLSLFMERVDEQAARFCPGSPYPAFALVGKHTVELLCGLLDAR